MKNEETQNANEHYEFILFVLSVYGKTMQNVVAVVGDNCNTNRAMSRRIGPIFVGCYSHRFNLAVRDLLSKYKKVTSKVQQVMKKLSYSIPAAQLRKLTPLKAVQANDTR